MVGVFASSWDTMLLPCLLIIPYISSYLMFDALCFAGASVVTFFMYSLMVLNHSFLFSPNI